MTSRDDISTPGAAESPKHRQHYGLTFAVLALGAGTYAVMQSLVAPALPEIQHDLHTSTTAVAWILTAYLLSASIFTPIVGRLGDMFGKERTLIVSLAALAAGTLLAALATNITVMIAGRVIQGVGGAIFPLAFGIIRDEFPRERIASGIAMISAILGIGAGLGIVLAGPIVSAFSYHWLFWIPFVLTLAATVATVFFVPESPIKTPGRINWLGAFLLSAWLVCLLVGISEGSAWGWGDPRILGLFAAAAVLLLVWIRNEQDAPEPLVDMAMMRIRGVWTVNAAAFLVGAGMYSSFILIPQFTEAPASDGYGFHASVTQAGLFLLPATVMMLVVSPLAGRMANRIGARVPLALGSLATCFSFAFLAAEHEEKWEVYVGTALLGIGIGLAFASLANLIVDAVPPEQTGVATGMNTVMRTLGGSVGSQIGASVIAGTVVAGAAPTEHGFTVAFIVAAVACGLATLASLAVPRPGGAPPTPSHALATDAA
ncbi:MAG TPA: MFS transporter [Solirubrobacteraceae bacterium]|jgi:EmrB/QacA subfamily drug resistance transporter|nr:MFS transporter [Solirubrobacteraceae bacterium]